MPEWSEEMKHFMMYWFSGLMDGLERIDESAREVILRACGKACAQSYTAEVFQEARAHSADMEAFLAALANRFPGATFEMLTPHSIRVCYAACFCDLVNHGLVMSPLLCECSVHNLHENFERALGLPVTVTMETSILRGGTRCALLVSF